MGSQEGGILMSRNLINAIEAQDFSIHPDTIRLFLYGGAFAHFREEAITGSYDALIAAGKKSIIGNQELLNVLADFSSIAAWGLKTKLKVRTSCN